MVAYALNIDKTFPTDYAASIADVMTAAISDIDQWD